MKSPMDLDSVKRRLLAHALPTMQGNSLITVRAGDVRAIVSLAEEAEDMKEAVANAAILQIKIDRAIRALR